MKNKHQPLTLPKKGRKDSRSRNTTAFSKDGGEKRKPENDVEIIDMHVQRKQTNYH